MPLTNSQWALVRHAYCESSDPIATICMRFGISKHQLYRHIGEHDWPKRGRVIFGKPRDTSPAGAAAREAPSAFEAVPPPPFLQPPALPPPVVTPTDLKLRVYRILDLKLAQLEKKMQSKDASKTSSGDHERETRALTTIARTLERVSESSSTNDPARSAASPTDGTLGTATAPDSTGKAAAPDARAEQLRRDIAERLGKIMERRNAPRDAG